MKRMLIVAAGFVVLALGGLAIADTCDPKGDSCWGCSDADRGDCIDKIVADICKAGGGGESCDEAKAKQDVLAAFKSAQASFQRNIRSIQSRSRSYVTGSSARLSASRATRGGGDDPMNDDEIASARVVRSLPSRARLQRIENEKVRAAAIRARDAVERSARVSSGDRRFTLAGEEVEKSFEALLSAAEGEARYETCAFKCNGDRLECKSDCQAAGKKFCGCGAAAVGCLLGGVFTGNC